MSTFDKHVVPGDDSGEWSPYHKGADWGMGAGG
jgi:hypothetical protein